MPKQSDDLSQEGAPSQETPKAKLKIPVPKTRDFDRLLRRAAEKEPEKGPSKPEN